MLIRKFTCADLECLRDIYFVARKKTFTWLDSALLKKSDFDHDTQGEKIWVAENLERIVGFISVWEPESFIHHLYVLPDFSRRGYGSALLEFYLTRVEQDVQLKCLTHNTVAMRFYQSRNFSVVHKGVSEEGEYYLMRTGGNQHKGAF